VNKVRCSFCGKRQDEVRRLIAGQNGVFICDQCIALCNEIMGEEFSGTSRSEPNRPRASWLDRLRRMTIALPR